MVPEGRASEAHGDLLDVKPIADCWGSAGFPRRPLSTPPTARLPGDRGDDRRVGVVAGPSCLDDDATRGKPRPDVAERAAIIGRNEHVTRRRRLNRNRLSFELFLVEPDDGEVAAAGGCRSDASGNGELKPFAGGDPKGC